MRTMIVPPTPPRKKARGADGGAGDAPRKREWPPHFESSCASYIFDARSGMFYEPASDFFYEPKTKLDLFHQNFLPA